MKIGISARGLSTPIGGARRVLDNVLELLPRIAVDHEIVAYQPPGTPVTDGVTPVWVKAPHAVLWEWVALPLALRRNPPDVLIAPKTLLPPFVPDGVKSLAVVLDLLYFPIRGNYPHEYRWRDLAYNRLCYLSSCRRATGLACISEHTRKDLLAVCPQVDPANVHVVPLGVDLPDPDDIAETTVTMVKKRYGLDKPYIFYAGTLSPRKNMVRGVQAFARIADRIPHDLVVTAGKSWRDHAVEQEVDRCGLRQRFRRLGAVASKDMPALYAGADVFFFPSLYEGFGLPILEAMACGCPVVASSATSIPEVAGSAACLVGPFDIERMSESLLKIINDKSFADILRDSGLARAAQFSWSNSVKMLVDIAEALVD
jgi:glycosyltransferase involved in cell wall biosynthesis